MDCKKKENQLRVGLEINRRNHIKTAPDLESTIGTSVIIGLQMRNHIADILDREIRKTRKRDNFST